MLSPLAHRKDIDGLRAIAVLAVILHHAIPRVLPGGFVGVDVFFVISGYLITSIILRDLDAKTFSFATFYERRVRRLLPNLTVLLLLCSTLGWFLLLPADFRGYCNSLFSTSVFTSNMFFWRDGWYFAAPSQSKPLLHTWSLAIEEQYYLLFPIVLWSLKRHIPSRVALACVAGFFLSLAMSIWGVHYTPAAAFYILPSRAWELLLGSLLVVGVLPDTPSTRLREVLATAGVIAIVVAVLCFDPDTAFPGVAALLPCVGAALVIYGGGLEGTRVTRLLSGRILVSIGLMSYSLYLWHWPLIAFGKYYFLSDMSIGMTAVLVGLSVLLAYLAWRYVEQPIRTRVYLAQRRSLVALMTASTAALVLFAMAGTRANGWEGRFGNIPIIDYDSVITDIGRDATGRCFLQASRTVEWHAKSCTHAPPLSRDELGHRRIFLIGDSFAAQFSEWLRSNYPGEVVELTSAACPALFDYVHEVRTAWCASINALREETLHSGRFTDVFIGAWWGQTQNPETMRALDRTVRRMLSVGVAHVTVLGTAPHFLDSPIDIINRNRVFGRQRSESLPANVSPAYRGALEALSRIEGVRVIHVDDTLCRDAACPSVLNGELLYADGAAHLTRPAVRQVMAKADWLMSTPTLLNPRAR